MHPYKNLDDEAFWKKTVSETSMFDISPLWNPKFKINSKDKVATFGSCFAQHIGKALKNKGYNWFVPEDASNFISDELRKKYNYRVFSARTGNIYTTSLLKQWVEWALDLKEIPDEVWVENKRYYDPFRPNIEPDGFESEHELKVSQKKTVSSFKKCLDESNFFVFTLGLTESWFNSKLGYEYPVCPGTIAGEFEKDSHQFYNQNFINVYKNLKESISLIRKNNTRIKILLTVSPVPLVATNSGLNVVQATMYSKSILRAVAGQLRDEIKYVDYFPSYEIINSPVFRGVFFEPNMRGVNSYGVDFVMNHFFKCQIEKFGVTKFPTSHKADRISRKIDDVVCEEELLDSFGK